MITTIKTNLINPPKAYDIKNYAIKRLITLWRKCIKAFIEEVLIHVHVDTGMSVASIQPLATNVGLKTAIIESLRGFGPKPGHKEGSIKLAQFQDNIGKFKSRSLGSKIGRRAYALEFGSISSPQFKFTFEIVIFQWFLHESTINWIESSNWQALEFGKIAFLECWDKNLKDVVRLKSLMKLLVGSTIYAR